MAATTWLAIVVAIVAACVGLYYYHADPADGPFMKAYVYTSSAETSMAFGEVFDVQHRALQPGQVLVRVHAAALNPVDYKLPKLLGRLLNGRAIGQDFSGVVIQSASPHFRAGDAVFGNAM
jgi:NADPH:quinone reductase-like Zn-dependent oxidoreductase